MDDKKKTPTTHGQVSLQDRLEIDYWTQRFGVTTVQLKAAVNAVGPAVEDVEAWLKKK